MRGLGPGTPGAGVPWTMPPTPLLPRSSRSTACATELQPGRESEGLGSSFKGSSAPLRLPHRLQRAPPPRGFEEFFALVELDPLVPRRALLSATRVARRRRPAASRTGYKSVAHII